MAAKLSDDERQRIVELCGQGLSCNAIAKETGRSPDTVSRIAAAIGHQFGQQNAARAREIASKYGAERRAATAARLHEEADRLIEQLRQPHLAFNFGGRDNTYNEHEMAEPPIEGKRQLMQAAQIAMRTVLDIDKHDNAGGQDEASKGLIVRLVGDVRSEPDE